MNIYEEFSENIYQLIKDKNFDEANRYIVQTIKKFKNKRKVFKIANKLDVKFRGI